MQLALHSHNENNLNYAGSRWTLPPGTFRKAENKWSLKLTSIFYTIIFRVPGGIEKFSKDHLISKFHFGVFKFFQKTNAKQVKLRYHSSKSNFFVRFLEELRIISKKSFGNYLTFSFLTQLGLRKFIIPT